MIKMAMVQEIRVRDVMSPAVVTLPASCTVRQATQVLFDARVSGAPVVGSGGEGARRRLPLRPARSAP
jgi:predicted transcriptional regulator